MRSGPDYLAFYEVTVDADITDFTWRRVFDPASAIAMRVAELDGAVVGFTLCLTHEGTWIRGKDCYLEDLFVSEDVRGKGVGRALMDDLVALCKKERLVAALLAYERTEQNGPGTLRHIRQKRRPHPLPHQFLSCGKPSYHSA